MEPSADLEQNLADVEIDNNQLAQRRAAIRALGDFVGTAHAKWHTNPLGAWRASRARATLTTLALNPTSEYLPVREEALTALNKNTKTKTSRAIHQIAQSSDTPEQLRVVAVALLGTRNDRAANRLVISLASSDMSDVATQAVKSLDASKRRNRKVIVHAAQTSQSPQTQIAAIERLAERPTPKAVRTLVTIATTTDLQRRTTAINALADSPQKAASRALAKMAKDTQQPHDIRQQAITGLAKPHHHNTAVSVLPPIVDKETSALRTNAFNALHSHKTPQAEKKINKLMKDHPDLRDHTERTPPTDTELVKNLLAHDTANVLRLIAAEPGQPASARVAAAKSLSQSEQNPAELYHLAKSGDPETQALAIKALNDNPAQIYTDALASLITSPDLDTKGRTAAAAAIKSRDIPSYMRNELAGIGKNPDTPQQLRKQLEPLHRQRPTPQPEVKPLARTPGR